MLYPDGGDETTVDLRDALLQFLGCQSEWQSVATFDSALHLGLIGQRDLDAIFAATANRFLRVRERLDARAESGPESRLRLIVADEGLDFDLQVRFGGVGRVDMVVERCLVLEEDSRVGHAGWDRQLNDRSRDLERAKQGFVTLRPTSEHIFNSPELVRDAILALLAVNRRYPLS